MVQLTTLRKARDVNGDVYLTGRLGSARIFIFRNKHKEEEGQPDYLVYTARQRPADRE